MTKPPPASESTPPQSRWRLRFSLRTWLILVSLLCLLFVYLGRVERQRRIVKQIENAGGHVYYTESFSSRERWLRAWLDRPLKLNELTFVDRHSDFFENIDGIAVNSLTRYFNVGHHEFDLEIVAKVGTLNHLNLTLAETECNTLAPLSRCTSLQELVLFGPFDEAELHHIESLKSLTFLSLSKPVSDTGVLRLGELKNLERLFLNRTAITDHGLQVLSELPNLKELSLIGTRVSDQGLKHVALCPNLEILVIWETEIKGPGLRFLARLPRLKHLNLRGVRIEGDDLKSLAEFPALKELELSFAPVGDRGIAHVVKCRNLRRLEICDSKVTHAGIKLLRELPLLTSLTLDAVSITDADLAILEQFPSLENVGLSHFDGEVSQPDQYSLEAEQRLRSILDERKSAK